MASQVVPAATANAWLTMRRRHEQELAILQRTIAKDRATFEQRVEKAQQDLLSRHWTEEQDFHSNVNGEAGALSFESDAAPANMSVGTTAATTTPTPASRSASQVPIKEPAKAEPAKSASTKVPPSRTPTKTVPKTPAKSPHQVNGGMTLAQTNHSRPRVCAKQAQDSAGPVIIDLCSDDELPNKTKSSIPAKRSTVPGNGIADSDTVKREESVFNQDFLPLRNGAQQRDATAASHLNNGTHRTQLPSPPPSHTSRPTPTTPKTPINRFKLLSQPASSSKRSRARVASPASTTTIQPDESSSRRRRTLKRKFVINISSGSESDYAPSDDDEDDDDLIISPTKVKEPGSAAKKAKTSTMTSTSVPSTPTKAKNTCGFKLPQHGFKLPQPKPANKAGASPAKSTPSTPSHRGSPKLKTPSKSPAVSPSQRISKLAASRLITAHAAFEQEALTQDTIAEADRREERAKANLNNVDNRLHALSITPGPSMYDTAMEGIVGGGNSGEDGNIEEDGVSGEGGAVETLMQVQPGGHVKSLNPTVEDAADEEL